MELSHLSRNPEESEDGEIIEFFGHKFKYDQKNRKWNIIIEINKSIKHIEP